MSFQDFLTKNNACQPAKDWATGKTMAEAWETCHRGDWLLWLAQKRGVNLPLLTLAKARCAETALHLMHDERSKKAVSVALSFGRGMAAYEELQAACYDAYAAADAATYAAYDAADAADATYYDAAAYAAATYAAYAAADAAYAAYAAADAADAAYYADAAAAATYAAYGGSGAADAFEQNQAAHLATLADIVRQTIKFSDL